MTPIEIVTKLQRFYPNKAVTLVEGESTDGMQFCIIKINEPSGALIVQQKFDTLEQIEVLFTNLEKQRKQKIAEEFLKTFFPWSLN